MSLISPAAHRKFIAQCQNLINSRQEEEGYEKTEKLKKDLHELQQLAETYLHTLSRLLALVREYNMLHRRIRINARKIQPVKNTGNTKAK